MVTAVLASEILAWRQLKPGSRPSRRSRVAHPHRTRAAWSVVPSFNLPLVLVPSSHAFVGRHRQAAAQTS
jgi:hypothetical protein